MVNYIVEHIPLAVDPASFWSQADVGGGESLEDQSTNTYYAPFAQNYIFEQDGLADGGLLPLKCKIRPADPTTHYVAAADFTIKGQEPTSFIGPADIDNQLFYREWENVDGALMHPEIWKIWIFDLGNPTFSSQGWGLTNEVEVWAWVNPNFYINYQDVQFVLDIDGDARPVVPTSGACFTVTVETDVDSNINVHAVLPGWWDPDCAGCQPGYTGSLTDYPATGWAWEVVESGENSATVKACVDYGAQIDWYDANNFNPLNPAGFINYNINPEMFSGGIYEWIWGQGIPGGDPMRWFILKPKPGYALSRHNLSIEKVNFLETWVPYSTFDGSENPPIVGSEFGSYCNLEVYNENDVSFGLPGIDDVVVGGEEIAIYADPPYITPNAWATVNGLSGEATDGWNWNGDYLEEGHYRMSEHWFPSVEIVGGNYGDTPVVRNVSDIFDAAQLGQEESKGVAFIDTNWNFEFNPQDGYYQPPYYWPLDVNNTPGYECGCGAGGSQCPIYQVSWLDWAYTDWDDGLLFNNGELQSASNSWAWANNTVIFEIRGFHKYRPFPQYYSWSFAPENVDDSSFQGDPGEVFNGILNLPNLKFNIKGNAMQYYDVTPDVDLDILIETD